MEITLKDSEIDNFIRYLNTASTIPLTANDITVGDPIDLGTLPRLFLLMRWKTTRTVYSLERIPK